MPEYIQLEDIRKVLKLRGLRNATISTYLKLLTYAMNNGLENFKPNIVNDFLKNSECKQSTKHIISSAIKTYYAQNGEQEKADAITKIKFTSRRKGKFITYSEMNRMIDVCKNTELKLFLIILRDTGLRRGICENLRPSMIDLKTGKIDIPEKIVGNKAKINFKVYLTPETLKFLLRYIKQNNIAKKAKIFKNLWEKQPSELCFKFRKLARQAGLAESDKISPHIFRHSFSTNYIYRGGSFEGLRYLLGHKHLSSTQRYSHRDEERAENELKELRVKGVV